MAAGGVGSGVVWGWLSVGLRGVVPSPTNILYRFVATAVLVAGTSLVIGGGATTSFVFGGCAGLVLHSAWRTRLRRRCGLSPANGRS
jgi:hypothetical protein